MAAEYQSFTAACRVVDKILECERAQCSQLAVPVFGLRSAMHSRMELHPRAYDRDLGISNHRHQMHCPEQFLEDDGVYDMLVVERLNLRVKAVGTPIDNARRWEYRLLCSPLTRQRNQFAGSTLLTPAPLGRIVDMPGNPSVKIANRVRAYGKELAVSDVVHGGGVGGVIIACCEENGVFYLLADKFDIVMVSGRAVRSIMIMGS